ncbi:DUF1616 domain-containing protein [Haladaptatus sp. DYSN1]|uniref:DUF1616 domain-containing protein n=1 Tax=unclassified Haladaptatus TaxID=2622732 RepID=UPI0024069EDE|nr:DUF1616 domain-containing protein [Haladaptatus sp. DYSN1]
MATRLDVPYRSYADLTAINLVVLFASLTLFVPAVREWGLHLLVVPLFLLFVPGYALVAAAFPGRLIPQTEGAHTGARTHVRVLEWVVFSLLVSIVVVPLIGLATTYTAVGLRLEPVVLFVSIFTLVASVVAGVRRRSTTVATPDYGVSAWLDSAVAQLKGRDGRSAQVSGLLVVAGLVLVAGTFGYVASTPPADVGEQFTEYALLAETETGTYAATGYPSALTVGEPTTFAVGITNHEGIATEYTVVVLLQEVDSANAVVAQDELLRQTVTVGDGSFAVEPLAVSPTRSGERLRLTYLFYEGAAPASPSSETASEELYLWVSVSDVTA